MALFYMLCFTRERSTCLGGSHLAPSSSILKQLKFPELGYLAEEDNVLNWSLIVWGCHCLVLE